MYLRLALILALIAGVYLVLRWFVDQPPAQVARAIRRLLFFLAVGVLLYLVAAGRLHWLFALIASILPLLRQLPLLRRLYQHYRANQSRHEAGGPQTSNIETRFLRMSLDHETGEIDGEILSGEFTGRCLAELELDQLLLLLQQCQLEDSESALLIENYLERRYGEQWREQSHTDTSDNSMTREEALQVLGLEEGATQAEIIAAHRRLMQRVHPDRGGSDWMAAKLNRAKELLLG